MIEQFGSCSVCGNALASQTTGYLLVARSNPSRIMILRWNRTIASREAAQTACSPEHALEIVTHWMVSGRLDFHFAQAALPFCDQQIAEEQTAERLAAAEQKTIGELVIARESVRNLVARDPEALASILDSLLEAMLKDSHPLPAKKPVLRATSDWRTSIA